MGERSPIGKGVGQVKSITISKSARQSQNDSSSVALAANYLSSNVESVTINCFMKDHNKGVLNES